MDIAQLRKTVQQAIEGAKKDQAARRARADAAGLAYERFLEERAAPVFRSMANVLKSEGLLFDVMTPSGGVRLVPERTREDGIELTLDASLDPPRRLILLRAFDGLLHGLPELGDIHSYNLTAPLARSASMAAAS